MSTKDIQYTLKIIEKLRSRLLDLSGRNNLISYKHTPRSVKQIRIIDESLEQIAKKLREDDYFFRFLPIPEPEVEFEDEKSKAFTELLIQMKQYDAEYLKDLDKLGDDPSEKALLNLENRLRDRIREKLNLPNIQRKKNISLEDQAKLLGLDPNYELPINSTKKSHSDSNLQTLLYQDDLQKRLKSIYEFNKLNETETGITTLFCSLGFLEWYESESSEKKILSPLILLPIKIERSLVKGEHDYKIVPRGDEILNNESLSEKLKQDFGIVLTTYTEEMNVSDFFESCSDLIKRQKNWKIRNYSTIGFFSFAKFLMYKDLKAEKLSLEDLENSLVFQITNPEQASTTETFAPDFDIDQEENKTIEVPDLVTDADSSQISAVIDVLSGKNLVIEGPPGTGKSQTITNIIAACLNVGKTVLFVAEKNAALQVVKSRLDKSGLGHFCFELHSKKTQKLLVYKSLQDSIKFRQDFNGQNRYPSKKEEIENVKEELKQYVKLLSEQNKIVDSTYHDIIWRTIGLEKKLGENLVSELRLIEHFPTVEEYKKEMKLFEHLQYKFKGRQILDLINNGWYFFDLSKIDSINLSEFYNEFYEFTRSHLSNSISNEHEVLNQIPILKARELLNFSLEKIKRTICEPLVAEIVNNRASSLEFSRFLDDKRKLRDVNEKITALQVVILKDRLQEDISNLTCVVDKFTDEKISGLNKILEDIIQATVIIKDSLIKILGDKFEADLTLDEINRLIENISEVISLENEGRRLKKIYILPRSRLELDKLKKYLIEIETREKNLDIFFDRRIYELSIDDAFRWRSILINAGFFTWFNSDYKDVSNKLRSYLKTPFNKQQAIEHLLTLSEILRIKKDVSNLNIISPLEEDGYELSSERVEFVSSLSKQHESLHREMMIYFGEENHVLFDYRVESLNDIFKSLCEVESLFGFYDKNSLSQTLEFLEKLKLELNILINAVSQDFKGAEDKKVVDVLDLYKYVAQKNSLLNTQATMIHLYPYLKNLDEEVILSSLELSKAIVDQNFSNDDREQLLSLIHGGLKNLPQSLSRLNGFIDYFDSIKKKWCDISQCNSDLSFNELSAKFKRTEFDFHTLEDTCTFLRMVKGNSGGYTFELLKLFSEEGLAFSNLVDAFSYVVCFQESKKFFKRKSFTHISGGEDLEYLRDRFSGLDTELQKNFQKKLIGSICKRKIEQGDSRGRVSDRTEFAFLSHQFQLKSRHAPVRVLLNKAPRATLDIMPCFMMSPLTLSQYIPIGKMYFDVLIMDEASQLRPEDSIGALLRAKQVVVVGDQKQLPPTSFFDNNSFSNNDDNDDIEDEHSLQDSDTDFESILAMSVGAFKPSRRLRWHYRSKHHDLINYSNKRFYDEELVIFPSPAQKSELFGIEYHYISDAVYENKRNIKEAEALLNWFQNFILKYPDKSVAIVTMNQPQQELISDLLELRIKSNPVLQAYIKRFDEKDDSEVEKDESKRLEPLIIKNLENIQGDERDVVLISTVYGKELGAPSVKQRFGPINSKMGHRRLNVLITRSRFKNVIFTSLDSSDVVPTESSSLGVTVFKEYLNFAKTQQIVDYTQQEGGEPDSDFEKFVIDELKDKYKYKCQVGVSGYRIDIGILDPKDPLKYLCGIECDGATYHSAKSVRDRDKIRQEILESLGWKIYRIWSTDWFKNKDREIKKLFDYLESLKSQS